MHSKIVLSMNSGATRVPFQYPTRRVIVRSRNVSKPSELYLKLPFHTESWQTHRQHSADIGSIAADAPVKFRSDAIISTFNLPTSKLHEILRCDVLSDTEAGPSLSVADHQEAIELHSYLPRLSYFVIWCNDFQLCSLVEDALKTMQSVFPRFAVQ